MNRGEVQPDAHCGNANRNNSLEVKMAVAYAAAAAQAQAQAQALAQAQAQAQAQALAQAGRWTGGLRVPQRRPHHVSRHYMTVPAGGVRVNRRHSLNVDAYEPGGYVSYPRPGGSLRSKRSLSLSGGLPQAGAPMNVRGARDGRSRSEWLLESAL